ncbi:MAG TPA: SAM-dependent methyltransferase [Gammaproteobacteria bacterium]|nr:SAM-dependent methyltransferase [Gammaproteobacteria bacterium]
MPNQMPIPSPDAFQHSMQLLAHIFSEIKRYDGKISFAKYMDLALYTPGLGYYSGGMQKFGTRGDFVTAPELSTLFSKCLARQCQEILENLGGGDILEIGAGSGQMAADILLTLTKANALPNYYYILELSADLKKRQQEKIATLCPAFFNRVVWLETLPLFDFKGVILANEVLDAMPVHQFQIHQNILHEMEVTAQDDELQYQRSPTKNPRLLAHYHSQTWPTEYTSEINLHLKPWIMSLSDILKSGVILIIDYGFPQHEYYHPQRSMGTLMCHYRHYAHHDPFLYPGLQDITAHVDFTAIAEAASEVALDVLGYTSQAAFLFDTGLMTLAEQYNAITDKETLVRNHAIQTLTSPAEMGELFKVIALGRNFEETLMGFKLMDRRYTL